MTTLTIGKLYKPTKTLLFRDEKNWIPEAFENKNLILLVEEMNKKGGHTFAYIQKFYSFKHQKFFYVPWFSKNDAEKYYNEINPS